MDPILIWKGASWVWRIVSILVTCALVYGVYWFVFLRAPEEHRKAVQATTNAASATSGQQTAENSTKVLEHNTETIRTIEHTTEVNHDRIIAAAGASDPVSPDVAAAWHDGQCMRDLYRGGPSCP